VVPLATGDFCTVQSTGHSDLYALRTNAHGVGQDALHGASKHHATLELLCHTLGYKLRIKLRLSDLGDVDLDIVDVDAGHRCNLATQTLDILTLLANDDAWPCRVNCDDNALCWPLDLDAADRSVRQLLLQKLADLDVVVQVIRVVLGTGVPRAVPVLADAKANTDRDLPRLLVCNMTLVGTRCSKLAELVPDHILGDQHRHVNTPVVHGYRQANHVREDH